MPVLECANQTAQLIISTTSKQSAGTFWCGKVCFKSCGQSQVWGKSRRINTVPAHFTQLLHSALRWNKITPWAKSAWLFYRLLFPTLGCFFVFLIHRPQLMEPPLAAVAAAPAPLFGVISRERLCCFYIESRRLGVVWTPTWHLLKLPEWPSLCYLHD